MDYKPGPQYPTLCWGCKNTNRFKCPWFNPADPQPVPGWVAEPRVMYRGVQSYLVKECPKFEPEPPREERREYMPVSGVTGVRWDPTADRWDVRINSRGNQYYLGRYASLLDAIAARKAAEKAIARGEEPQRKRDQLKEQPQRKELQREEFSRDEGCRGVRRVDGCWVARIGHNGKRYYLGCFKTKEEAVAARKAAEEAIERGEKPRAE